MAMQLTRKKDVPAATAAAPQAQAAPQTAPPATQAPPTPPTAGWAPRGQPVQTEVTAEQRAAIEAKIAAPTPQADPAEAKFAAQVAETRQITAQPEDRAEAVEKPKRTRKKAEDTEAPFETETRPVNANSYDPAPDRRLRILDMVVNVMKDVDGVSPFDMLGVASMFANFVETGEAPDAD